MPDNQTTDDDPPPGLRPVRDGDNFHYWNPGDPNDDCAGLVIFPCSTDGAAVLDGKFTPKQLRAVADWIEKVNQL